MKEITSDQESPAERSSGQWEESYWLIFALPLILGFLGTQLAYRVLHLHEIPFLAANGGKRLEVLLFYGFSITGGLIALIFQRYLKREGVLKWSKPVAFLTALFVFIWVLVGDIFYIGDNLLVMNLALLWLGLSLVYVLFKKSTVALPKFFVRGYPIAMLALCTAATAAQSSEPQKNKFLWPLLAGFISVASYFLFSKMKFKPSRWIQLTGAAFVVFIFILTFPAVPTPDTTSLGCLIGPIMQDLFGYTALVDYVPHYGLANGLVLAPFFRLLGGVSFDKGYYAGYIMCVASWLFIFIFTKKLTKSWLGAILCVFFTIAFQAWGNLPIFYSYYSMGPYRFGLPLALLGVVFAKRELGPRPWLKILEFGLIGLASVWSFETFIFVMFPYLIWLAYERRLLKDLPLAILSVLLFWGAIEFSIWRSSGQLGDIRLFFESVGVEAVGGMSASNIHVSGTWVPLWVLLACGVGLSAFTFIKRKKDSVLIVTTATFFVCLSYYVNRSIDGVFLALAPLAACLCIYLVFCVLPKSFRIYFYAYSFALVVFYLQGGINGNTPGVFNSVSNNFQSLISNLNKSYQAESLTPVLGDGLGAQCGAYTQELALLKKLLPQGLSPIYIIARYNGGEPSLDFAFSMCTGRPNGFNLNPSDATYWSPLDQAAKIEMAQKISIPSGEILFVDIALTDTRSMAPQGVYAIKLIEILKNRFSLEFIESAGRIAAFRMK